MREHPARLVFVHETAVSTNGADAAAGTWRPRPPAACMAPGGSAWWERRAAALVRARLEEAAIRIDQLSVGIQAFARRQDPDREVVYFDILCAWELDCGRKLTFSRNAYSVHPAPTGDLIKYFEAAAHFILGNEAPGRHGIADIVDKYRKRDRMWATDLILGSPDLGVGIIDAY
jgi:hypothetical protein